MQRMAVYRCGLRKQWAQRNQGVRKMKSMKNQRVKPPLPATDSTPKPGDFPLGSIESRAAARSHVQQSIKGSVRTTVLIIGWRSNAIPFTKASIGEWYENPDGSLTRHVTAPSEMLEEDALEIFGTKKNPIKATTGFYILKQ